MDDKGNKVLKVDATGSWSGASVDGVGSLKEHGELWATDRVKVDGEVYPDEIGAHMQDKLQKYTEFILEPFTAFEDRLREGLIFAV